MKKCGVWCPNTDRCLNSWLILNTSIIKPPDIKDILYNLKDKHLFKHQHLCIRAQVICSRIFSSLISQKVSQKHHLTLWGVFFFFLLTALNNNFVLSRWEVFGGGGEVWSSVSIREVIEWLKQKDIGEAWIASLSKDKSSFCFNVSTYNRCFHDVRNGKNNLLNSRSTKGLRCINLTRMKILILKNTCWAAPNFYKHFCLSM